MSNKRLNGQSLSRSVENISPLHALYLIHSAIYSKRALGSVYYVPDGVRDTMHTGEE